MYGAVTINDKAGNKTNQRKGLKRRTFYGLGTLYPISKKPWRGRRLAGWRRILAGPIFTPAWGSGRLASILNFGLALGSVASLYRSPAIWFW
jgi:hypothetical protein